MKIYTASKTKHADKWKFLRDQGLEIISTWIDEAGPGQTTDRAELANRCIREAIDCDVMLLYYEPGEYLKGAFIELGVALAVGKRVYAVGESLPETSVFRSSPLWRQFETIEEALEAISAVSRQMSEVRHTPGPWRNNCGQIENAVDAVCTIQGYTLYPNARADADLIAAAPDLLVALEKCVERLDHSQMDISLKRKVLKEARAAIKKAKGESR